MFLHPNLLIQITDYLDFSTLVSLLRVNINVGKRLMKYCYLEDYVRLVYQDTSVFGRFRIERINDIKKIILDMNDDNNILKIKAVRYLTNNDNKNKMFTGQTEYYMNSKLNVTA